MAQRMQVRGRATRIETNGGWTFVRYHSTDVVRFNYNTIILSTGGWETVTTKLRMNQASNQFGLGYTVYQKNHVWYCDWNGKTFVFPPDGILTLIIPPAESPDWRPPETIPEDYYA